LTWKGFLKGTAAIAAITTMMQIPGILDKRGEYDKEVKSGTMTADDAAKAKGGDIGGLVGGLAGLAVAGALLAPFTAGMSVPVSLALGSVVGGVGFAAGDSLGKSIGSSVSGASSEPSPEAATIKERELRNTATSASSSERMVLLLAEIRDVVTEHRDIAKGVKEHRVLDKSTGLLAWQMGTLN